LSSFDDFDGDVKGDGDEILKEDDAGPEGYDSVFRSCACDGAEFKKVGRGGALTRVDSRDDTRDQTHEEQNEKVDNDL
jgi:hypothetical protein